MYKKYLRRVFVGCVVAGLVLCLSGYLYNKSNEKYISTAKHLLEEKYSEKFEIKKCFGRNIFSQSYEVICYPVKNPSILFEASVAYDKSEVSDEYIATCVCKDIEKQIKKNMCISEDSMQIRVQAVSMSVDSIDTGMSIQDFVNLKITNRSDVYLVCDADAIGKEKLKKSFELAFNGLECINGDIHLYLTNERVVKHIGEYLCDNAKLDYDFDVMLSKAKLITIPFAKGIVDNF